MPLVDGLTCSCGSTVEVNYRIHPDKLDLRWVLRCTGVAGTLPFTPRKIAQVKLPLEERNTVAGSDRHKALVWAVSQGLEGNDLHKTKPALTLGKSTIDTLEENWKAEYNGG